MSELRESFPTLENTGTQAGEALASKQVGVAPGAHNGLMGFSFIDSNGNLVLPMLDSEGRLPITSEGAGVEKAAAGVLAAGSATMVLVTGASIALTVNKVYREIKANVSCFRDAVFNIIFSDNGVETIIGKVRVGSGQYTYEWSGNKKYVTAGATGPQLLIVKGQNPNSLSELSCEISCVEAP